MKSSKDTHERNEYFTGLFRESLKNYPEFEETIEIARRNSSPGEIWVIGGFVYRNIIQSLYGESKMPEKIDIDFLIEKTPKDDIYLPEGWEGSLTRYGDSTFSRGRIKIDLNHYQNFRYHDLEGRVGRIKDFFTGNPLNVQSIAYSLDTKKVMGFRGIDAIREKIIRINCLEEAEHEAEKRNLSLEEYVKHKAEELGFNYEL